VKQAGIFLSAAAIWSLRKITESISPPDVVRCYDLVQDAVLRVTAAFGETPWQGTKKSGTSFVRIAIA
jgi:hypothetical protein